MENESRILSHDDPPAVTSSGQGGADLFRCESPVFQMPSGNNWMREGELLAVTPSTFVTRPLMVSLELLQELPEIFRHCFEGDLDALRGSSRHSLAATHDGSGLTPLMAASMAGHTSCALFVLEAAPSTLDRTDRFRRSALFYALFNGHLAIADALLDRNPQVHVQDSQGWSLLHALCGSLLFSPPELSSASSSPSADDIFFSASERPSSPMLLASSTARQPTPLHACDRIENHYRSNNLHHNIDDEEGEDEDEDKHQYPDSDSDDEGLSITDMCDILLERSRDSFRSLDFADTDLLCLVTQQQWSVLHLAVHCCHLPLVRYLCRELCSADSDDLSRVTAKSTDALSLHLSMADAWGRTCVHLAACSRADESAVVELIRFMLEKDAPLLCRDLYGRTPLHIAAAVGKALTVPELSRPYIFNMQDKAGFTALHLAVLEGHLDAVLELLRSLESPSHRGDPGDDEADPNRPDHCGRTPLHLSPIGRDRGAKLKIIGALLDHHWVNQDAADNDGRTPLFFPLLDSSPAAPYAMRKLLEACDSNATDSHGRTAAHYAAFFGNRAALEILLREDQQLACLRDRDLGYTPFHAAILCQQMNLGFDCAQAILRYSPQSAAIPDKKERLPLYLTLSRISWASEGSNSFSSFDFFVSLLTHPSSSSAIFASTSSGKTLLHRAVELSLFPIAIEILQASSNPSLILSECDVQLHNVFHILSAAKPPASQHSPAVSSPARPSSPVPQGLHRPASPCSSTGPSGSVTSLLIRTASPLHAAIQSFFERARILCGPEAFLSLVNAPDSRERTPLVVALLHGNLALADLLMRFGADTDYVSSSGVSLPLFIASAPSYSSKPAALNWFLNASTDTASVIRLLSLADAQGRTPFQCALRAADAPFLDLLLHHDVAPAVCDLPAILLPLIHSCRLVPSREQACAHILHLLFAAGHLPAPPSSSSSSSNLCLESYWLPVHVAAISRLASLFPSAVDPSQPLQALSHPVTSHRLAPVHLLLSPRADRPLAAEEEEIMTILDAMSAMDPSHACLLLLDARGRSALHYAAYHGLSRVCETLLASPGLTPELLNHADADGLSAVFHALLGGHAEVAPQFVAHPCFSIDSRAPFHTSLLHLAAGLDHPSLCIQILQRFPDALLQLDSRQCSPLDHARKRRATLSAALLSQCIAALAPALGVRSSFSPDAPIAAVASVPSASRSCSPSERFGEAFLNALLIGIIPTAFFINSL